MKKILAILLVFAMLVPMFALAEENAPVPGNRLGIEALLSLTDGTENASVSPVSLLLALSLAAEGANGQTLDEMLAAMDLENIEEVAPLMESLFETGLSVANSAFVRPELEVFEEYTALLEERYGAEIFEEDGPVMELINAWVEEKTDGMIGELLSEEPDPEILLMLVNAIAMDAEWRIPFMQEGTYDDVFHAPGGDVTVPFMHNNVYFSYAENDVAQVVKLPYTDTTLSMYVMLPKEEMGVTDVLDVLYRQGEGFGTFTNDTKIILSLPKVSLETSASLADFLAEKMPSAFSPDNADFSGMSDVSVMLAEVLQEVRIDVDELGTKAAAATMAMAMATSAMREPEPIEMNVDCPYVMAIIDDATGAIAFLSVVAEP